MNLPPMLLAATVLFWGWQSGQWWLAAALAAALEAPRITNFRLAFSSQDLGRVADLCTLLLVATALYLYFREGVTQAIIGVVQWMPVILLLLFLAIAYSGMRKTDLSAISLAMRRRAKNDATATGAVNLGHPYLALWVLAASVSNQQGWGFYLGLLGLGAWALWPLRPRGYSPLLWGSAFLLAALAGGLINTGLYRLQEIVEQAVLEWISSEADEDPERTRTSLGHIGELKLSDSIALRVSTSGPVQLPLLLKTASYNTYAASSWSVSGGGFADLTQAAPAARWRLHDAAKTGAAMEISTVSARPAALIALPPGALEVDAARFNRVSRNRMGTLQAQLAPGFYAYRLAYDAAFAETLAPLADDLKLPRGDSAVLLAVVRRLQLEGKPPAVVLPALKTYFADNFSYSTFRSGNAANHSALSDFLTRNRSGHCEHFATATVLLLRAAGIPARYAVGYSVDERSRFGSGYVARRRHAHAWVSAYVNGAWQDFDTTPASWPALEQDTASPFEPLLDLWSWLLFHLQKSNFSGYEFLAYAIALAALLWFGRKINWRKAGFRRPLPNAGDGVNPPHVADQAGSQLYRIERILAERGLARPRHEPFTAWLTRISPQIGAEASAGLLEIVHLHYRWRFGPQPAPDSHPERLSAAADYWIARFGAGGQDPT